jgi:predicted PurR-regulated permease PerM
MREQTKINFQKAGIFAAVYLVLRYLLPLVLPFFLAFVTVYFLAFLRTKWHLHMKLFTISILYLFLFILLLGGAGLSGYYLLRKPCQELLPICLNYWNLFTQDEPFHQISAMIGSYLTNAMPSALSGLFGLILYLLSTLLFAKDLESVQSSIMKLPFAVPVSHAVQRMTSSIRGWCKAQCKIMLLVSIECAIGYYFLKIPAFLLWAVLTGFVDALPVFGTGTIFLPWMLITLLQKNYLLSISLAGLFLLTWLTRELLEPKLLGDGLGLLPIYFLISVMVGLELFGPIGLFTGPFGVLLVKELWKELEMWVSLQRSSTSSSADGQR